MPAVLDEGRGRAVVLEPSQLAQPCLPELFEQLLLRSVSANRPERLFEPADPPSLVDEHEELVEGAFRQAGPAVLGQERSTIEVGAVQSRLVEGFQAVDEGQVAAPAPDEVAMDIHDAQLGRQAAFAQGRHVLASISFSTG